MLICNALAVLATSTLLSPIKMEMPEIHIPKPSSYAKSFARSQKVWMENGVLSFVRPELGLSTQCSMELVYSEMDREGLRTNSISQFRLLKGTVQLIPLMWTGDQFSRRVDEVSYLVQVDNGFGAPVLTTTETGFTSYTGTRLSRISCQGRLINLEVLERVFEPQVNRIISGPDADTALSRRGAVSVSL